MIIYSFDTYHRDAQVSIQYATVVMEFDDKMHGNAIKLIR